MLLRHKIQAAFIALGMAIATPASAGIFSSHSGKKIILSVTSGHNYHGKRYHHKKNHSYKRSRHHGHYGHSYKRGHKYYKHGGRHHVIRHKGRR